MNIHKLREYCQWLWSVDSLESSRELIYVFLDFFFLVINKHHEDKLTSQALADAKMIFQMIFTKVTHINKLLGGVGFNSKNGGKLNPIIDPTSIAPLIRTLYEIVCVFHLIYILPDSQQKKDLVYNLWVSSGLKYRQRFNVRLPDSLEKLEQERIFIERIKEDIENSDLFKSLTEKNKSKIFVKLKEKDYKISFTGLDINFLSWQEVSGTMGLENDLFADIYSYFSLYAHPSNVSVFQFEMMFSKENEAYKRLTLTSMKYCIALLSIFVADYIKLFPNILETFNKQDLVSQIVLNFHNHMLRGEIHSINDAWKSLG
ncbi:DUF5677 domain-containing protein [Algoriphagus sp. AK58]|uniref:DUF5677 domain-containing protein n=1 Tax=Algoriphagus sp. AK58 TaxID=1406877 RepID=UPI00164FF798|nr:DUF5677 domain-containing protein [Algoriphagus sp. AK58]MBC6367615.1 hypothetical protein [Algoriphagus sp. AK58]